MKTIKYMLVTAMIAGFASCTSDFTEINTNPNDITTEEASARYFLTNVEYKLYAPDRYPYWRAQLIHADRYAGQVTFGFNGSWWSDELGYTYSSGYTDAAADWLSGYFGGLDNFMKLTGPGGIYENDKMYAVGQIIKGLYFQMYTDTFGEIPYSQVGDPSILTPKFDSQKDIYKGIISELDKAMTTIGDAATTGGGIEDLGENDLFCKGDLQLWKKMANTLKLRIALRAKDAPGDDFSGQAINEALAAPLLDEDILMKKDNVISQWASACYGDVWYNFGVGSDWKVSQPLIDYLRDNNDPRLGKYAKPVVGGTVTWKRPDQTKNPDGYDKFPKRTGFILQTLSNAGVPYTKTGTEDSVVVQVPENEYYVGQPVRLNGFIYDYVPDEFFSDPAEEVIQAKGQGKPIFPEIVMSSAESYFLQAEAAVRGMGGGNANELYQKGITQAMRMWNVADGEIEAYLSSSVDLAKLSGDENTDLERIAVQRWIAAYTDGFEAWADVRKSGYPASLAAGVSDIDIYGLGDINGDYPTRMQYGNAFKDKNGANYQAAVASQGPDKQNTKLWFEQ